MGLSSRLPSDARYRDGPHRRDDRRETPAGKRFGRRGFRAGALALALALGGGGAGAETLRIATFDPDLTRTGPGLLLRDIQTGEDPQIEAAAGVIASAAPDVLLLTGFDYDLTGVALSAFAARVAARGLDYPYRFALHPNSGMATGLDLDGDGRLGRARDAQGYGRFAGSGGMAILSRRPILEAGAADYSAFLWRDLPGAAVDGAGLSPEVLAIQRLSTTGHWAVPVELPGGKKLTLLAYAATTPAFDGPEDRNGRRAGDESLFWLRLLDGALGYPPPEQPFVILGLANLDPVDGEGPRAPIAALLSDPRLQDPQPRSPGGAAAGSGDQKGDPALDTGDWPEVDGPGNLRVDYVLPAAGLRVTASGVWWPAPGTAGGAEAEAASRHRLVWVDLDLP